MCGVPAGILPFVHCLLSWKVRHMCRPCAWPGLITSKLTSKELQHQIVWGIKEASKKTVKASSRWKQSTYPLCPGGMACMGNRMVMGMGKKSSERGWEKELVHTERANTGPVGNPIWITAWIQKTGKKVARSGARKLKHCLPRQCEENFKRLSWRDQLGSVCPGTWEGSGSPKQQP